MSPQEERVCKDSPEVCALGGAASAIAGLRGSAIIVHGSPGCGWTARWMRSDHALTHYTPVIATSLLEREVIKGGTPKLIKNVEWVLEHWKPQQLFIIGGCTGSLINDPIASVAARFEKEKGVPIIPIDMPGFKGLLTVGYDETLKSILRRWAGEEVAREPRTVNLVAPSLMGSTTWPWDLTEITRLLQGIGLKVNCVLTADTTLEQIRSFNAAEAVIMLTYDELPAVEEYCLNHGLPVYGQELPLPLGVTNTNIWLQGLAEKFGREQECQQFLRGELEHLKVLQYSFNATWIFTWLSGKSCAVIGPATWAAAMSRFLYYDLNCMVSVVIGWGEGEQTLQRMERMLEPLRRSCLRHFELDPLYNEIREHLAAVRPDFVVGMTQDKVLVESLGIAHLSLAGLATVLGTYSFLPYPAMGYRGVLFLMTMLGRVLEGAFHEPSGWKELQFRGRENENNLEG